MPSRATATDASQPGMDGYVSKPLRSQQLYEVLEGLVTATDEVPPTTTRTQHPDIAFDLDAALELVDGDAGLLKELAGLFLGECPRRMAEIRQAIDRRDASKLHRAAHALKGSVSHFAARAAVEAAQRLESDGHEQNWARAEKDWTALEGAISRLEPAFIELTRAGVS